MTMADERRTDPQPNGHRRGTRRADGRGRGARPLGVEIVVVFADGVVRKRINTHATKARAELAADLIRRTADRDIGGGPVHG